MHKWVQIFSCSCHDQNYIFISPGNSEKICLTCCWENSCYIISLLIANFGMSKYILPSLVIFKQKFDTRINTKYYTQIQSFLFLPFLIIKFSLPKDKLSMHFLLQNQTFWMTMISFTCSRIWHYKNAENNNFYNDTQTKSKNWSK